MFKTSLLIVLSIILADNSAQADISASLPRIINGKPITIDRVPAQASVFRLNTFICGAIIISRRTAITAGHCVLFYQYRPEAYQLRYGSSLTSSEKRVQVARVSIFPAYSHTTLNYDLAVLTLEDDVDVPFARLPEIDSTIDPGTTLTAVGWGLTENSSTSTELLMTRLKAISLQECRDVNPGWLLSDNMFCAVGAGSTTCGGDSGNGIYSLENSLKDSLKPEVLLGVISWGDTSCSIIPARPAGFADLANREMRQWMKKLVI
uniref:Trypsin-16 n=1 Tax=Nilaparvata lugens TaxID=108931 RepID=A0A068F7B1_NILLU|nr:trypsin-16 [Nilaparvata lugens]